MKITPIRKATEKERQLIAQWTIGVSQLDLKGAMAYFPLESVEKMIAHRESVYNHRYAKFRRERAIKMIPTTDKDVKLRRTNWLHFELTEIDRLCKIPFISDSETIELGKYRDHINMELKKDGLSYTQQAVIYAYENKLVQRGHPCYKSWLKYNNRVRRIETEDSRLSLKQISNRVELFESILSYLSDKALEAANEEISTLKAFLK
jgi:hypothetical protein